MKATFCELLPQNHTSNSWRFTHRLPLQTIVQTVLLILNLLHDLGDETVVKPVLAILLHEPHIYCGAKGKEHKKYGFGTKASVVLTKNGGIIVGAVAHEENLYDGSTLPEVLQQTESLTGSVPTVAIVDRGIQAPGASEKPTSCTRTEA